eukprot:6808031-Karenia_brevis.AAC.1
MGKVLDWAQATYSSEEPKGFWSPDFQVMICSGPEGNMGARPTTLLCTVAENSEIKWEEEGLK